MRLIVMRLIVVWLIVMQPLCFKFIALQTATVGTHPLRYDLAHAFTLTLSHSHTHYYYDHYYYDPP